MLCCIGIVWVVAYAADRYESAKAERIADGFKAMQAAAVADDSSLGGINHHLEESSRICGPSLASCAAGARRWPSAWSDISRVCATIRPQIMTIRWSVAMSLSIGQPWPASTGG